MPTDTIPAVQQRPAMSDVDVYGITHPGRVRKTNADHFFIGSLHRSLRVHQTSVSDDIGPSESDWRGFVMLVADGVGNLARAEEGSASALRAVTQHLLHASEVCELMAVTQRETAVKELEQSIAEAHRVLRAGAEDQGKGTAATTLTMYAAFWPLGFVVHVGDSRLYRFVDGKLERHTTDQTMAQMMVEAGAMSREQAEGSHLKHVLWSAVGAEEAVPDVKVLELDARARTMICSDGLTKHVSDDEIRQHMASDVSSEELCRALVDLALERGGSDNVTVVSGRVRRK